MLRPAYGHSPSPVAVSQLPQGGPLDKGLPLDSGIPGYSTFAKPVDDIREPSNDDESIRRVDDANDLTKSRDRIDTREDNADKHDGIGAMGKGEWSGTEKTRYPYRDGIPNSHYASVRIVAERWLAETARSRVLRGHNRVATTLDQIAQGLSEKVLRRSKNCNVTLKRRDLKNLRWIYSVDAGNGPKVVKMKAIKWHPGVKSFGKMDFEFSCSCEAWRWLGPEYHAKREEYIIGKPRGTASTPDIKDPERINRVCKHVAAVITRVRGKSLY